MSRTRICNLAFLLTVMFWLKASGVQATEPSDAKTDTTKAVNELNMDAQFLTRGEIRMGGLPENETEDDFAAFLMERTRLIVGYSRPYLDTKISVQHSGVWGQSGKGVLNLYESWVQLKAPVGLFAKIGRQELAYDNERIIGSDDWAMAASSHDVAKLGYEGHGHKVHLILGFNQNSQNISGGTYYVDGAQPYKSLQTIWYHYDVPRTNFGASLLFMNIGTEDESRRKTRFQKLAGAYLLWTPGSWFAEASYYRQFGHNDENQPIKAWMVSANLQYRLNQQLRFTAGYDFLSGDEIYHIRRQGQMGLIRHKEMKGFTTLYGSHHQFSGAMDFFYMSAFLDGFSPGLQNIYAGIDYSPLKKLKFNAKYHYLATAVDLQGLKRTLGHEIELSASYQFWRDAKLSTGYTQMLGTETMKALKQTSEKGHLRWVWLSLSVNPHIFTHKW